MRSPLPSGLVVWRRRAHIVVWDERQNVTVPGWPLYWSDSLEMTFVRLRKVGSEGLWLPLRFLRGHWDWLTGTVAGWRVYVGYGPDGMPTAQYQHITSSPFLDPDTGRR